MDVCASVALFRSSKALSGYVAALPPKSPYRTTSRPACESSPPADREPESLEARGVKYPARLTRGDEAWGESLTATSGWAEIARMAGALKTEGAGVASC